MGAVYLAERIADGEQVAFKVLLSEHALNEEFRARFDRESRYASALEHPNIVRVHEVGGTDEMSYMVMDFIDGSDLATKLAERGNWRRPKPSASSSRWPERSTPCTPPGSFTVTSSRPTWSSTPTKRAGGFGAISPTSA